MTTPEQVSFPRLSARTGGFRRGAPRQLVVSPDGSRIVFVRSDSGTDQVNRLLVADVDAAGVRERLVVDPSLLLADDEELPAAERARRERMRETTAGITAYSADDDVRAAVFALSGRLFHADLIAGTVRELPANGPAVDPRISPDGAHVAYVRDRELRVLDVGTADDRALRSPGSETEAWGLADFIAGEELDRVRGHWWSPDSRALLVEQYDEAPVSVWWLADPAHPDREPQPHRYPAAGTANAEVALHLVRLDGSGSEVVWDHTEFPYVAGVHWSDGPALVQVLSRDQKRAQVLAVDPAAPAAEVLDTVSDPAWIDVVVGAPRWDDGGRLVTTVDDASTDTRRLVIDGAPVTPAGMQVLAVTSAGPRGVVALTASDPVERVPVLVGRDGTLTPLAPSGSVASALLGGPTIVTAVTDLASTATAWQVTHDGVEVGTLLSHAAALPLQPRVHVLRCGPREVVTAVLFPSGHVPGSRKLPVVMAPYGGPHHSEVVASGLAFASDQWLADQGFAVVIADGRGTPARGPAWERAVFRDFAGPVLEDQVDALHGAAAAFPDDLDLERVGITGWSFGGWLSALAVLERPDVFHAAVAGAPPTDWSLYDTAYTERYLGTPLDDAATYASNSLIGRAPQLSRPLMLVHGLVDDNVVVAHTLRLSSALMAAGRAHTVLPLTGITHMASQEDVAEALLLLQVEFLRRSLG